MRIHFNPLFRIDSGMLFNIKVIKLKITMVVAIGVISFLLLHLIRPIVSFRVRVAVNSRQQNVLVKVDNSLSAAK